MKKWVYLCGIVSAVMAAPAAAFDCNKAYLPVDFVICSDPEAKKASESHEKIWEATRARLDDKQKQTLLDDQRKWIKHYPPRCGIPAKGTGKAPTTITAKAKRCVTKAILARAEYVEHYLLPASTEPKPANSEPNQTTAAQSVTSTQIAQEYDQNEVRADTLYKGKSLQVSGTITGITQDRQSRPVILLEGVGSVAVRAEIDKNQDKKVIQLNKGDTITLKCTGKGVAAGDALLGKCGIL